MKRLLIGCLVLVAFVGVQPAAAQVDPCSVNFEFKLRKDQLVQDRINWKRIGERMETCESLVVLSDTAYQALFIEQAFRDHLLALSDSLAEELRTGQVARDSLLSRQTAFIAQQRRWIMRYDTLLTESNQLVEDATANTDRALRQISLFKWGTLGIVVGVLAGALLAN